MSPFYRQETRGSETEALDPKVSQLGGGRAGAGERMEDLKEGHGGRTESPQPGSGGQWFHLDMWGLQEGEFGRGLGTHTHLLGPA